MYVVVVIPGTVSSMKSAVNNLLDDYATLNKMKPKGLNRIGWKRQRILSVPI